MSGSDLFTNNSRTTVFRDDIFYVHQYRVGLDDVKYTVRDKNPETNISEYDFLLSGH